MLISDRALQELAGLLAGTAPVLRAASVQVEMDPLELVRAGGGLFSTAIYFGRPGSQEIGGLGAAWRTVAPYGTHRFGSLFESLEDLHPHLRALLGFSFDPDGPHKPEWDGFTSTAAVVPLVSAVRSGETTHLVMALPPGRSAGDLLGTLATLESPGPPVSMQAADHTIESRPAPAAWVDTVGEAVAAMEAGNLEKVVLARSVIIRSDVAEAPFDLVARLRAGYPGCFAFGWQEGEATFLGATPELLVARDGSRLRSQPLAGSAPRGEGEAEDRDLGEALMASDKNRQEHAAVVEDIRRRLGPLVEEVHAPAVPRLVKMANVQHLATEITGTLTKGRSVVELAGLLHPTPAVGGTPRSEALAFIRKAETVDRGWYSGGIGWTDHAGNGEIALALRCALLRGETAHLFAGAGIVAGSDPQAELEETRLKFRPLLNLLAEA